MYRVMISGAVGLLVAGCSLGYSRPFSAGFADSSSSADARIPNTTASLGDSGSTAPVVRSGDETRVARLDDRAPSGSYDRADRGSLSGRDYSATSLNAEAARDLINSYRKKSGLKALKLDPSLTSAAKAHARDLAKWDRISHFGSDGSNPWDRVKRTGYKARLAAENVGTGQADISEVFKGWQQSPGHNKNLLLADAEHMGIALVTDPKTEFKTFWTLVLGSPM